MKLPFKRISSRPTSRVKSNRPRHSGVSAEFNAASPPPRKRSGYLGKYQLGRSSQDSSQSPSDRGRAPGGRQRGPEENGPSEFRPRGPRSSTGEFRPRGNGGEFRPRGPRSSTSEFRPRGNGNEFRPSGPRSSTGEFRPRGSGGEFRPRGPRSSTDEFRPHGNSDGYRPSGPRNRFGPSAGKPKRSFGNSQDSRQRTSPFGATDTDQTYRRSFRHIKEVRSSDPAPDSFERRPRREAKVVYKTARQPVVGEEAMENAAEGERVQKVLAREGLGSRREIEEWIVAGRLWINGAPANLGQRILPTDQVSLDRQEVKRSEAAVRILLYYKPEGEVVTHDDPERRATVFDRLPHLPHGRWLSAGRLDLNSCGLLILTTSGEIAEFLCHPRYEWEREYAVRVIGEISDDEQRQLLEGVALEDGPARLESLEPVGGQGVNRWYRVVLREGRYREVRRMFEHINHGVSRLMRTRFGPFALPPGLHRGQWVECHADEIQSLLDQIASSEISPAT